jgi:hypothetical protein
MSLIRNSLVNATIGSLLKILKRGRRAIAKTSRSGPGDNYSTWDMTRDSWLDLLAVMALVMLGLSIFKMGNATCSSLFVAWLDTHFLDYQRCGTNRKFRSRGMAKRLDISRTASLRTMLDGRLSLH